MVGVYWWFCFWFCSRFVFLVCLFYGVCEGGGGNVCLIEQVYIFKMDFGCVKVNGVVQLFVICQVYVKNVCIGFERNICFKVIGLVGYVFYGCYIFYISYVFKSIEVRILFNQQLVFYSG